MERKSYIKLPEKIVGKSELLESFEKYDRVLICKNKNSKLKNEHAIKITPFIAIDFVTFTNFIGTCMSHKNIDSFFGTLVSCKAVSTISFQLFRKAVYTAEELNLNIGMNKKLVKNIFEYAER
jgi:hypothetical protein